MHISHPNRSVDDCGLVTSNHYLCISDFDFGKLIKFLGFFADVTELLTGHLYQATGPLLQRQILLSRERAILQSPSRAFAQICVLSAGVVTNTDTSIVPLPKPACKLRRRRAESCLHKL